MKDKDIIEIKKWKQANVLKHGWVTDKLLFYYAQDVMQKKIEFSENVSETSEISENVSEMPECLRTNGLTEAMRNEDLEDIKIVIDYTNDRIATYNLSASKIIEQQSYMLGFLDGRNFEKRK